VGEGLDEQAGVGELVADPAREGRHRRIGGDDLGRRRSGVDRVGDRGVLRLLAVELLGPVTREIGEPAQALRHVRRERVEPRRQPRRRAVHAFHPMARAQPRRATT
jgi:hypothetical protein